MENILFRFSDTLSSLSDIINNIFLQQRNANYSKSNIKKNTTEVADDI